MWNILALAILTYIGMVFFTKYRTPIAVLGSAILLIYGTISGHFPAQLALFAKVFERCGLFDYMEYLFINTTKGNKILIVLILPMVIYASSLFMNNLTVILLFTFTCLKLLLKFKLPVIPLLVTSIIASNIGGATLPWSDTPAVKT